MTLEFSQEEADLLVHFFNDKKYQQRYDKLVEGVKGFRSALSIDVNDIMNQLSNCLVYSHDYGELLAYCEKIVTYLEIDLETYENWLWIDTRKELEDSKRKEWGMKVKPKKFEIKDTEIRTLVRSNLKRKYLLTLLCEWKYRRNLITNAKFWPAQKQERVLSALKDIVVRTGGS